MLLRPTDESNLHMGYDLIAPENEIEAQRCYHYNLDIDTVVGQPDQIDRGSIDYHSFVDGVLVRVTISFWSEDTERDPTSGLYVFDSDVSGVERYTLDDGTEVQIISRELEGRSNRDAFFVRDGNFYSVYFTDVVDEGMVYTVLDAFE